MEIKKKRYHYASGLMIFNQSYDLLIDEAIKAKEMGFKVIVGKTY